MGFLPANSSIDFVPSREYFRTIQSIKGHLPWLSPA
jgi:hypothetical protein